MRQLSAAEAELRDLARDPDYAGEGLNHLLLTAAEEHCRQRGYERLLVWNYRHQERARRHYERRGWWYVSAPLEADLMVTMDPVRMALRLRRGPPPVVVAASDAAAPPSN